MLVDNISTILEFLFYIHGKVYLEKVANKESEVILIV